MVRKLTCGLVTALVMAVVLGPVSAGERRAGVEPWREKLYEEWHELPEPPITPYGGPFGGQARAFTVRHLEYIKKHKDKLTDEQIANLRAIDDYSHTAPRGVYDPTKDPRPRNRRHEEAMLEDWRRMGYNCSYKGHTFTFMVGKYLKEQGMLGAIDQTIWGNGGPPPLQFDGKKGKRQREACGSFFASDNFQAGVSTITGMGHHYGHHLFTVGDHRLTCSWDEVGLRTRAQMDYREPSTAEFRRFLEDVWFEDAAPNKDTNGDGRTYNQFTGQDVRSWDEVQPVNLSLDWAKPGWGKGGRTFSAMPEVDKVIYREPGRYKLRVDFHRYYTFEFFRRINEQASKNINKLGTKGRISCYPFVQHFIIWPGANQRHGNSFYWYHRLSPVVNVEHCWPDAPVMNLNYAVTDRLAPKHKNAVMGWIWFYFGQEGWDMYNGPHDMDRALARMMGHRIDGSHHWLYSPRYRSRDRKQRLQIAYWQNFVKYHYRTFLSRSAPPQPQVAVLMPDYTGYFYRYFQYPKQDFAWTMEGLQNMQYQYHLITEEELELHEGVLDDYKVLYVIGSEWSTPTIRRCTADFMDKGGVVFANVDSLSLDIPSGKRVDFLQKHFGVDIQCKYKNCFYPSTQTAGEAMWALQFARWGNPFKLQGHMVHRLDDPRAWAKLYKRTEKKLLKDKDGNVKYPIPPNQQGMKGGKPMRHPDWKMIRDEKGDLVRDEAVWKKLDAAMAEMPKKIRGIKQKPLDMREPPKVKYPNGQTATSWSEVDVASPVGEAKPVAHWGDEIVGIETDNTVWMGTRPGMSLHAISSRMSAHRGTEPVNPFPPFVPELYESHRPYAETIGYAAEKAGVKRMVSLRKQGKLPMNLEVLPRISDGGTMMVIVINHDKTSATYEVVVDSNSVPEGAEAWDMLDEKIIESKTDGEFGLHVPSWGVKVFMLGTPDALKPIKAAQRKLNSKDMSVPQYFLERPELNQNEWNTPIPDIEK